MNVTRNVIVDLLPSYAAGEAHADSARLVEEWLGKDATLAQQLAALRGVDAALVAESAARTPRYDAARSPRQGYGDDAGAATAAAAPDARELLALRRTRFALRLRGTLLGLAIFFTGLPFSVRGGEGGVRWLFLENPGLAVTFGAVAVAMWLGWFLFAARMRVRSGV